MVSSQRLWGPAVDLSFFFRGIFPSLSPTMVGGMSVTAASKKQKQESLAAFNHGNLDMGVLMAFSEPSYQVDMMMHL